MNVSAGGNKPVKRKWSESPMMQQAALPRSAKCSLIQVDHDLQVMLDTSDMDFSGNSPPMRAMELSSKPFSKNAPFVYNTHSPIPQLSIGNGLSPKKTLQLPSILNPPTSSKLLSKKRKKDFEATSCEIFSPKKILKKPYIDKFQMMQRLSALSKESAASKSFDCSKPDKEDSDSDVEVVEVKYCTPPASTQTSAKQVLQKMFHNGGSTTKKTPKLFKSKLNESTMKGTDLFKAKVSQPDTILNEADIAPFMATNPNPFPDEGNRINPLRWLAADGKLMDSGRTSTSTSTSGSEPQKIINQNKSTIHKKRRTKELEKLYKNLNEISWTHEKSFKNLMKSPDYIRHSERSAKEAAEKAFRKPKQPLNKKKIPKKVASDTLMTSDRPIAPQPKRTLKKNSVINTIAQKKSKMAWINLKPDAKRRIVAKPQKNKSSVAESPTKKNVDESKEDDVDEETEIFYQLSSEVLKKEKTPSPKMKAELSSIKKKTRSAEVEVIAEVSKVKVEPSVKAKVRRMQLKPDMTKLNKVNFNHGFQKINDIDDDVKVEDPKDKALISHIKPEISPSTSGLQNGKNKMKPASSSKNFSSTMNSKNLKNFYSKFNSFGVSPEMDMMQRFIHENRDFHLAFKNASKLSVQLEPLEHNKLLSQKLYEEFRKHYLEQAFRSAVELRDNDSMNGMFEQMLQNITNPNPEEGSGKLMKKKRPDEESSLRMSARQSEGAFRYKEIVVKKHPNYMQVILVPNSVKQNTLTVEALKELKDALLLAKKDPNCHAVLVNSSGTYFCSGIDLSPLIGPNKKQAAEEISNCIRDLVLTMGFFTKPLIAAVNGVTSGFGVALLTYCDVVLASDKATFCVPSTKIGYIPEGGITFTLPQVVGSSVASEMFLQGRRLTAEQAHRCGLVSEVLWPTRLMTEVMPRLKTIIEQPLAAMEATKTMVRCHLWDKLRSHLDRERYFLREHWLGARCQENIKNMLHGGILVD